MAGRFEKPAGQCLCTKSVDVMFQLVLPEIEGTLLFGLIFGTELVPVGLFFFAHSLTLLAPVAGFASFGYHYRRPAAPKAAGRGINMKNILIYQVFCGTLEAPIGNERTSRRYDGTKSSDLQRIRSGLDAGSR